MGGPWAGLVRTAHSAELRSARSAAHEAGYDRVVKDHFSFILKGTAPRITCSCPSRAMPAAECYHPPYLAESMSARRSTPSSPSPSSFSSSSSSTPNLDPLFSDTWTALITSSSFMSATMSCTDLCAFAASIAATLAPPSLAAPLGPSKGSSATRLS